MFFLFALSSTGQEAIFGSNEIVSPEIHPDNSVTFRIKAPGAREVKLFGDWMPWEGWTPGSVLMEKDDDIWIYTTESLSSELYSYAFLVDGFRTLDPSNPFPVRDVSTLSNIFIVGEGLGQFYQVHDVPHGSVSRVWYDSPGLKMKRRMTVYTPPGYVDSQDDYPVLYLLHGAGGDEEAWITLGRTAQILDNLIDQGKINPMIVVMPNGNVIQDAAPGNGMDGFYKPQFMIPRTMDGTYVSTFKDIITYIEKHYRVKTGKDSRAVAGLSMGGFHALHISRYYENTFDYVGLFSAAIVPDQKYEHSVFAAVDQSLARQKDNGFELYWIGIGKEDFLYAANTAFRKKLDEMDFEYTYVESEGGHTWRNWRRYLVEFLFHLF